MRNYLSNSNSKLKADSIFTFGIPAGESRDGTVTCPNAGACKLGCYAMQGFYVMPNVAQAQEERLELSKNDAFIDVIDQEIKRRNVTRLRIHDSGDFYSLAYIKRWLEIIKLNPQTKFYAYTKMVRFFKAWAPHLPSNFHVVFSEGGTQDSLIDRDIDRHSRVFPSESALKKAKYSNAFHSDRPTLQGKQKIGLVYHGHKSKEWTTA